MVASRFNRSKVTPSFLMGVADPVTDMVRGV